MDSPTIYDVSRLSGVSTATVSRAFTAPDRVRESTRRRVYAAAEALHYQPSAIARAMARQQTDKIAFLICKEGATILDEFYASICEGVMRRANGTNYQLLISTAEEWTRTAQGKQIEGVILAGNAQADLISEFQRQNIPVVLVNNRAVGFDLPCIVADETGGRLKNRVVLFCDELGTMPPFDILPLFSAGRSRRLTLVPIIQSLAQLEKNYGKEGAEIVCDNCQDTIFGGFAPQSKTAEALSAALGSRTVLSGSVSQGKESSQLLQMMERPLMTADELKSIPKGEFVVMKTGTHPMRTHLRLFLDWGITFEKDCPMPGPVIRRVAYAGCEELMANIRKQYSAEKTPYNAMQGDKR